MRLATLACTDLRRWKSVSCRAACMQHTRRRGARGRVSADEDEEEKRADEGWCWHL